MDSRNLCRNCVYFKPWFKSWAKDAPKCLNPDGIVFAEMLNNCRFYKHRARPN